MPAAHDPPNDHTSKTARAGGTWGHTWTPGGPGQSPEDAERERARRAGRKTKGWWKKYPAPEDSAPVDK